MVRDIFLSATQYVSSYCPALLPCIEKDDTPTTSSESQIDHRLSMEAITQMRVSGPAINVATTKRKKNSFFHNMWAYWSRYFIFPEKQRLL